MVKYGITFFCSEIPDNVRTNNPFIQKVIEPTSIVPFNGRAEIKVNQVKKVKLKVQLLVSGGKLKVPGKN